MISPDIFSVLRTSPEGDQHVLAFTNVTRKEVAVELDISTIGLAETQWFDLLSERDYRVTDGVLAISFEPYDAVWLICGEELHKSVGQSAG